MTREPSPREIRQALVDMFHRAADADAGDQRAVDAAMARLYGEPFPVQAKTSLVEDAKTGHAT